MRKRSNVILAILWMIVLVAGASSAITLVICGAFQSAQPATPAATPDVETLEERYARLDEVYTLLREEYYTELDKDALLLGAIRGMIAAAEDPYTFYYTPEEMNEMTEYSSGLYEGTGMLLAGNHARDLTILRVFAGSSAEEAGLQSGDIIRFVNGTRVSAATMRERDEATKLIRGATTKLVTFVIERAGETLTIGVAKRSTPIPRVEYQMLQGGIGYVLIYEFMGNDVTQFRNALAFFRNEGATGVIIDLRSNPGGLLTDVVEIADEILPEGLIVYTKERNGRRKEYYSDRNALDLPIALLVDSMSASASEILASAVREFQVGTIIGERTFGKGVVQTVVPFRDDGAGMQLTTATYYTKSGQCIHGVGVTPDIQIDGAGAILYNKPTLALDTALMRAYTLLTEQSNTEKP